MLLKPLKVKGSFMHLRTSIEKYISFFSDLKSGSALNETNSCGVFDSEPKFILPESEFNFIINREISFAFSFRIIIQQ